jgi:hypothetical protein
VWLFIQQLHSHVPDDFVNTVPDQKFICYFKFSEPTVILFGELIRHPETKIPYLFDSFSEAEAFAIEYVRQRYHF